MHEQVKEILTQIGSDPPTILRMLLAMQERFGHVPMEAVPQIARTLETTTAQVAGVLSYYPDLRLTAPGRHLILLQQDHHAGIPLGARQPHKTLVAIRQTAPQVEVRPLAAYEFATAGGGQ